MTATKITAPNTDGVSFIGGEFQQPRVWVIFGTGYTTSDAVTAYAVRAGYATEEVGGIPDEYTAQVARLEAYPGRLGNGLVDGADPNAVFMRDGHDGNPVDIRDILTGTTPNH